MVELDLSGKSHKVNSHEEYSYMLHSVENTAYAEHMEDAQRTQLRKTLYNKDNYKYRLANTLQ